jgi:hypothetical protein
MTWRLVSVSGQRASVTGANKGHRRIRRFNARITLALDMSTARFGVVRGLANGTDFRSGLSGASQSTCTHRPRSLGAARPAPGLAGQDSGRGLSVLVVGTILAGLGWLATSRLRFSSKPPKPSPMPLAWSRECSSTRSSSRCASLSPLSWPLPRHCSGLVGCRRRGYRSLA